MIALRRHLFAATWAIVSAQTLAIAFGTVSVCWPGEHTHGSAPAPDCAMHHQAGASSTSMQHGGHHGHDASSGMADDSGQRVTCHCPNDGASIFLGQVAILLSPATSSSVAHAVTLVIPGDPSIADPGFSPPSPPPRRLFSSLS